MGIPHYLIVDPRDGTWTYQWQIGALPLYLCADTAFPTG
jgi:hypothetical protein